MSNVLSLYFDGTIVQTLKVSLSRGVVTIKEARTFLYSELDDYLANCRDKKCVIGYNPAGFAQAILTVPPSAGRHTDKLVGLELKKQHPDSDFFVYFHRMIGETTINARPFNRVAAFSYDDAPLNDLIHVFNRYNIIISHIYPTPYSVFRLLAKSSHHVTDKTMLLISSLPGEKLCFLCENGEIVFVRKIGSSEAGLQASDIQSINMTVSYCLQSLRIKPLQLSLLNLPLPAPELSQTLTVPVDTDFSLNVAGISDEIINNYLAPLAGAFHFLESPKVADIRPSYYLSFLRDKRAFIHGTTLIIIISALLAAFALTGQIVISDLKSQISTVRKSLNNASDEIKTYFKLDSEVTKLGQSIELLNRHNSSIDPGIALALFPLKASADYNIKEIVAQKGDGFVTVRVTGNINTSGYSSTQAVFEGIIAVVAKAPGFTIVSSSIDVKMKTFTLEVRYADSNQVVKK